ncbi:MAG: hypothetical protein J6R47_06085 [Acholeplasmatales bacterium]|nr:hypothetical protein [Acholeplasmatales bacterium]
MEQKKDWLESLDNKAENKGNKFKTLWQAIKFVLVSLIVTVIQLLLVNLMYFLMADYKEPLPSFLASIFTEATMGEGNSNWGYVLPFLVSNLVANSVGYFLNKKKTFKSDAPVWNFVIYIVILILLILFSTWLQGVVANALNKTGINVFVALAPTIAAMAAGTLQMVTLFPLQKFVLLKEKKKEEVIE